MNNVRYDRFSTKKLDRRTRIRKAVKGSLVLLAVGVGAYYGAKKPLKNIAGDVAELSHNTREIGKLMQENVKWQASVVQADRDNILAMIKAGKDFTFYPGVGVLDHAVAYGKKKS